jgi:hypothetical protein
MPVVALGPSMKVMSYLPGTYAPKMFNVSVSNVKGPAVKPVFGGVEIGQYVIFGFLPPGCGLLLGGQSLGDRIISARRPAPTSSPTTATCRAISRRAWTSSSPSPEATGSGKA